MPKWDHELSRHERGYGYKWTKLRQRILERDQYLCRVCYAQGRPTAANQVDHIIPKHLDGTDDPDNLQSICDECHEAKSKAERQERNTTRKRVRYDAKGWPVWPEDNGGVFGYSIPDNVKPSGIPVVLVCGPPAAGKSTYIAANAEPGDLVIDFDVYRQRVGGAKWDTRQDIWRKAFNLRDMDIHSLSRRTEGRCYLIVTAPKPEERKAWCQALGDVTVELIKTPADVCIERIKADPRRQDAADSQIEAVKNWWRYN